MKIEIKFDKDFTAVLTELAWAIGDSIKQAMLDSAKPVIVEQAPSVEQPQAPVKTQDSVLSPLANPHAGQQPVQATTPQAPIQQATTPNPVPVKMPENISNSDAVNQFINGQTPTAPQAPPAQAPQSVPTTAPQTPTQAPTTAPSYDVQKLAVAAMQLKDAGRIGEIQELIAKYGVATIMQLKPEQYDAFAQDLISKGVKF